MTTTPSLLPPSPRRWLRCVGWTAIVLATTAVLPVGAAPAPGPAPSPVPPAVAPPAVPIAPGQPRASAGELVGTMRRALGLIAKAQAAKSSEAAFRTAKARAFTRALALAAGQLDELTGAVAAPDAKTPDAMARTGSALAALQVTFRYNGIEEDDVEDGFEKLAAAYNVFRRNYGRDLVAARTEAESALSPGQRAAGEELQKRSAALTKSLAALQPAVKDNPAAAFEVAAILKGLVRLERAPRDRRALLDQLAAADLLHGRREGLGIYLAEVFPEVAKKLDAATQDGSRAFREAATRALAGVFADEKPAETFARAAVYVEDLGVAGVTDAELPALFAALGKPAGPDGGVKADAAAARTADAQINADDPDDDTSLEPANGENDAAATDGGND